MNDQDTASFDLLVNIASYADDELKALSDALQQEEFEVSKRRRLLHGQLDILRAEMVRRMREKHQAGESLFGEGDVERLSQILASRGLPAEEA
jgi:hypothetical protein